MVGGRRGDWELTEGMAKEGNGEVKVTVRAKESKLDKRTGFVLGFCEEIVGT